MEVARLIVKTGLCRNDGLGDYAKHPLDPEGPWAILTTDTGNSDYNFMILIHELVEMYLTQRMGIREERITEFDRLFEERRKRGEVGPDDEPGDDVLAPYHREHQVACMIETALCYAMGIDPIDYDLALDKALMKSKEG